MATVRPERTSGWPAFFAWTVCGGLLAVSFLSFAGLFTLPLGFILLALLIAFAPDRRDRWGLLAGLGFLLFLIGVLNLGSRPCPEEGWIVLSEDGSQSCGGLVPWPWLAAGALVFATAVFLYQRSRSDVSRSDVSTADS